MITGVSSGSATFGFQPFAFAIAKIVATVTPAGRSALKLAHATSCAPSSNLDELCAQMSHCERALALWQAAPILIHVPRSSTPGTAASASASCAMSGVALAALDARCGLAADGVLRGLRPRMSRGSVREPSNGLTILTAAGIGSRPRASFALYQTSEAVTRRKRFPNRL